MAESVSLEWLDRTYLRELLRKGLKQDHLDVLELKIEPATAAGDNYGSRMLRIHTTIKKDKNDQEEQLSVIAKMLPDSTTAEHEVEGLTIFGTEAEMFITVLPAIDALLKKAYPEHETLQAECYGFDKEHRGTIFLQDLRQQNFRVADRFGGGLDQEHKDLVLKNLAKFHAASAVYIRGNPELKEKLHKNCWHFEDIEIFRGLFKNAMNGYLKLVSSWPDGSEKEKVLEKLNWMDDNLLVEGITSYRRDDTTLNVIIHGDFWTNNMMFKYEDSKPSAIKFVDFQLPMFNSPLIDLVHFIFTSLPDEVKFGDKDAFLKTYHDTFKETLERLNFVLDQPFTFEDLKNEFHKRLMHGLSASLVIYPISVCKPTDAPKLDEMIGENTGDVTRIYNNETMDLVLRKAIDFFEKNGVI